MPRQTFDRGPGAQGRDLLGEGRDLLVEFLALNQNLKDLRSRLKEELSCRAALF
jgi:hypothetical protein